LVDTPFVVRQEIVVVWWSSEFCYSVAAFKGDFYVGVLE
jgi:hypothetical protein